MPLREDSYAWFARLVKGAARHGRRHCSKKVADGRVFTGRQAVELKLVDQIGE